MTTDLLHERRSDPTENVIALVEAHAKTGAELRDADIKYIDAEIKHLREIGELRAEHANALNVAESKRIDAIRAVDVGAVATAAERAAQQASVLASQVGTSAETLRTLVASTAATMASSAAQFQAQVTERLALLERSQYKGEGRSGVADPQIVDMLTELKALRHTDTSTAGKSAGANWLFAVIGGSISMLVGLLAIAAALYAAFSK